MTIDIQVTQNQQDLPISTTSVQALVAGFIHHAAVKYDEVSIHFVDTATICQLHGDYFDDPTTTDCITFPMDDDEEEGYRVMGDVFVCPATAQNYVNEHGGNVYHEATLYVIHGLLHLLGYDDIDEADQQAMRAAEQHYLAYVEANRLWLHA